MAAVAAGALALAVPAYAQSGSITNVHATDGQVSATYTTHFSVCDSSGYCGWYTHAYQYPASQSCAPSGSHLTYVGDFHSTSGSETATDTFTPAYPGSIRICLYAAHSSHDYFIAQAVFTPSSSMSGAITNVHPVPGGKLSATYTTNFHHCTTGYCGWFPEAWEVPASQRCAPHGPHITYVGETHSAGGTETSTDTFYPHYDALRICLYARHSSTDYFIAEATYYRTPAPVQRTTAVVGNQLVSFYSPKACVAVGRPVKLSVLTTSLRGRAPKTSVSRVEFFLDRIRKLDTRPSWQATFSTVGFLRGSKHAAAARITFKQPHRRTIVKTLSRSFRFC